MFMADLCYLFYLHYQVIPKIACVFSKPYEVLNWSMPTVKQIWKRNHCCIIIGSVFLKKKHLKAIWPFQRTQYQALHVGIQRLTGFTINRALKRHG